MKHELKCTDCELEFETLSGRRIHINDVHKLKIRNECVMIVISSVSSLVNLQHIRILFIEKLIKMRSLLKSTITKKPTESVDFCKNEYKSY